MLIAQTLIATLERNRAAYSVVRHARAPSALEAARAARVPPATVAKAVVLSDGRGCIMAVLPGDRRVRIKALSRILGRHLHLAQEAQIAPLFDDCEPGAIPPLGSAYDMDTLLDESLMAHSEIFFVGGSHESLVRVRLEEFLKLSNCARRCRFSTDTPYTSPIVPSGIAVRVTAGIGQNGDEGDT